MRAVIGCYDIVMSRGPDSNPGTPGASSTSLGLEGSSIADSGGSQMSRDSTYLQMLSEIGMSGVLEPFRRSYVGRKPDPEKAKQMARCVPELVQLIISQ
jgi:hypothetical protein